MSGRELSGKIGIDLRANLEDRLDAGGMATDALRKRQPAGEELDATLEELQAHHAHQLQRRHCRLRRDVGVAVSVAADPRAEVEERRDLDLVVGVVLGERPFEIAIHGGNGVRDRPDEVDEAAPDLVEHGQGDGPQLVRSPQLLDGCQHLPADVFEIRVGALVELAQEAEDALELLQRRAPASLGRMRGHHQAELSPSQEHRELGGGRPSPRKPGDRFTQRPTAWGRGLRQVAPAQAADAVVVLGQIDELEPPRQRTHEELTVVEVESGDELGQAIGGGAALQCLSAEGDDAVVELERRFAVAAPHHLVENFGEQRLVGGEVALGS